MFLIAVVHTAFFEDLAEIAFSKISDSVSVEERQAMERSSFLAVDQLVIPTALFYSFSLLAIVSYFRLICTDISYDEAPDPRIPVKDLTDRHVCRECRTLKGYYKPDPDSEAGIRFVRRPDIQHCVYCRTCCELHSHHCDVVQVCICGANFKFFVLTVGHASLMFFSGLLGLAVLHSSWQNEDLKLQFYVRTLGLMVVFGILGLVCAGLFFIFLCDSALCSDMPSYSHIGSALESIYPESDPRYSGWSNRKRFCLKYFGSSWNPLVWILPI